MGLVFDTSLEISSLKIKPRFLRESETWLWSLPKFEYVLNLTFNKKSTVAPAPKKMEPWRVGFVQTVLWHNVLFTFQKKEFLKLWTDPMIDSLNKEALPFDSIPTEKYANTSDAELKGDKSPGQIRGPSGQGSYDIIYGPDGYTADFQSNPFLGTVKHEISLAVSETGADTEPSGASERSAQLNPTLSLWVSDYPNVEIPWLLPGVGQLQSIKQILFMNFWIVARTPSKTIPMAFSSPFTVAGWMEFPGLSDSKVKETRELPSTGTDSGVLCGDFRQKLVGDLKSLQKVSQSNPSHKLSMKLAGPKTRLPNFEATETANDIFRAWIGTWTPD